MSMHMVEPAPGKRRIGISIHILAFWLISCSTPPETVPDYDQSKTLTYNLEHSSFSDYLRKKRWIDLPQGTTIQQTGSDLSYPVGTVISKKFSSIGHEGRCSENTAIYVSDMPEENTKLCDVELRTLEKTANGWMPRAYRNMHGRWEGVTMGANVPAHLSRHEKAASTFEYRIPSLNECRNCHTNSDGLLKPIGAGTTLRLQLNSELEKFVAGNTGDSTPKANNLARAYLDINCGYCHNPNGSAASSALFLHQEEQRAYHLGICKKPVVGSGASVGSYIVSPQKPETSILIARMASLDPHLMMPEVGRRTVDQQGIDIISTWIQELENTCQ